MALTRYYLGVHAYYHYSDDCWVIKYNGRTYRCNDDELDTTIEQLVTGTY